MHSGAQISLIISDLSRRELLGLLGGPGLDLCTGPFVSRISSTISGIGENLHVLYADYPIAKNDSFTDFFVRLDRPWGVRRWVRPQVLFRFESATPFKPLPLQQAFAMFEWGLNWCVSGHCHQYLVFHAAVVEKNGHAMILPAPAGSGKSTLCAGLVTHGWRLLSDELTLLDPASGCVVPLPRPVGLKNASIDVIRRFVPDAVIGRLAHDTAKGTVAHMKVPRESVLRAAETALPGWIVYPRYVSGSPAQLQSWPKARAFMHMANNAFNYSLHGASGFDALARLIDGSICYEFAYSDLDEAIALFDQFRPPAPQQAGYARVPP